MADQVVDNLIVEIRMRTEALERGLSVAEARIDDFTRKSTNSAKKQANAAKGSAQEQAAAHAAVAAAATAAFAVIVGAIKSGVDAANQYTSALTGLRSIAEGTGQNFATMQGALKELTADGLIPVSDAATALKNLLSRGFEAEEAVNILKRLKDAAAYGRQASLSLGEAVRSATEGIRNENSILVDNAGVTKNVAKMWEEYAKQLGKSANDLSLAEKRQAEYNGIMQETRFQIGDAAKYAASFAGTQAELQASTLRTEQAFGNAVQSGLKPFMEMLTPLVGGLGDLINQNPALVSAIAAGTTAFTGFVAVLVAAKTAADFLKGSLAGMSAVLGWAGVGAVVIGVLVSIASASTQAAQATAEYTQAIQDNIAAARQEQTAIRNYQALVTSGTATHAELAAARQKIIDQSPQLVAGYDAEGNVIVASDQVLDQHIAKLEETIQKEKELLLLRADETIKTAQSNIEALDAERREQERIFNEQSRIYEEQTEKVNQLKKAWAEALAAGDTQNASNIGRGIGHAQNQLYDAEVKMETSLARMREIDEEYAKSQSELSKTRLLQYQAEVEAMGELSAAQQYLIEIEMEQAAQNQSSAEIFRENAEEAIANKGRLAAAERILAREQMASSEAVKAWADSEKNLENIRNANTTVAEARKIKTYTDIVKQGQKGTKEYGEAVKALATHFKTSEKAVEANIDSLDAYAGSAVSGAIDAQSKMRASLDQAIADLIATKGATDQVVISLQALRAIFDSLGVQTTPAASGGGGTRKKAWEEELEMIQRVMDADDEYAQQYLEHIESLLQNDRLSKTERARLEKERQYAQMAVNNELAQAHIEYLENLLRRERLNAEQRLEIEQRLFEAKRSLMSQYDDFADAITSAITARAEAQRDAQLSSIQDQISAVSEWENRQTDAIRTAMNERLDAISAEIRALDDLAKANDRAEKDEEDAGKMRRLQAQLAFEKDERNRQKLLEQIAALETSINKRKEQEKLEDQKQALKDQQDAIRTESEAQIKIIQEQAEQERAALNRRLQAAQAYWDSRLSMESIQQEALQFLNEASQQEIIALLEKYAPEYLNKGKLLGSQLYGGLKPKIDTILDMIASMRAEAQKPITITVTTVHRDVYEGGKSGKATNSLAASIAAFAAAPEASFARMVNTAQQAMDSFAYRSIRPAAVTVTQSTNIASSGRGSGSTQQRNVNIKQTVVMQQPVPSPYQNARALRRESEKLAKLF